MKPFANQAKDSPIIDTLFNHIQQQIFVNIVEETLDTLPISTVTRKKSKLPGTATHYKENIWSFSDGVIIMIL